MLAALADLFKMLIGLLPTPLLNKSSALPTQLEQINCYMLRCNICRSVFRPTVRDGFSICKIYLDEPVGLKTDLQKDNRYLVSYNYKATTKLGS